MARLKPNSTIKTVNGKEIAVQDVLGEGGQGIVYKVLYDGEERALKWYSKGVGDNTGRFYENIKRNIEKGSPAPTFLWPLALTEILDGKCFGYVMELRPAGYKDFDLLLLNKVQFKNFSAIINAALQITASFRKLHNLGFSYQDLNDGNFFINPENGHILICDNDNVAPGGQNLGIQGKPKYMAPEVVNAAKLPDTFSDRLSLAVILFLLLCKSHPLDGLKDNNRIDPAKNEMNLYCLNPIFIFDPADKSNRPNPEIHKNALLFWEIYPKHIQELFVKAFSKELMQCDGSGREDRIIEKTWLKELTRLRSEIAVCPFCEEETFFDTQKESTRCINCGKSFERPPVLRLKNGDVILQPERKIYRYQIDDSVDIESETLEEDIGIVIRNKNNPAIWGLRNTGKKTWVKRTPQGKEEMSESGKVIPVARGLKISFGTAEGEII
ncbi:MAG: protein kinase domain-containing protein [Treponema sp.]